MQVTIVSRQNPFKIVRQHHQFSGYEFEQTLGDSGGERSLVCYNPQGRKKKDMTQRLNDKNNNKTNLEIHLLAHYLETLAESLLQSGQRLSPSCDQSFQSLMSFVGRMKITFKSIFYKFYICNDHALCVLTKKFLSKTQSQKYVFMCFSLKCLQLQVIYLGLIYFALIFVYSVKYGLKGFCIWISSYFNTIC